MKSNRALLGRLRETTRITPRRQTHLFWVILCRTMSVQVYKRTISVWKIPSTDAFSFFFLYVCNLFTATCWTNAMQPLKLTVLQSETKQNKKKANAGQGSVCEVATQPSSWIMRWFIQRTIKGSIFWRASRSLQKHWGWWFVTFDNNWDK